jgi:hypothetical protein
VFLEQIATNIIIDYPEDVQSIEEKRLYLSQILIPSLQLILIQVQRIIRDEQIVESERFGVRRNNLVQERFQQLFESLSEEQKAWFEGKDFLDFAVVDFQRLVVQ